MSLNFSKLISLRSFAGSFPEIGVRQKEASESGRSRDRRCRARWPFCGAGNRGLSAQNARGGEPGEEREEEGRGGRRRGGKGGGRKGKEEGETEEKGGRDGC